MLQISITFFLLQRKEFFFPFHCRFLRSISMNVHKQLLKLTTNMSNAELDLFSFEKISWQHTRSMVFMPFVNLAFPFHLFQKTGTEH